MKSRREAESSRRVRRRSGASDTEVNRVSPPSLERTSRKYTKPAEPSVPRTAPAPSPSGQGEPADKLQPTPMQAKMAVWTTLSPQKSRTPPHRDCWNFNLASSPSHPSRIECARNRSAPMVCINGREDKKNGPPQMPAAMEIRLI